MNKKTITLVLIFLIVINTIYWLYVTIKVSKYDEWVEKQKLRAEIGMVKMDKYECTVCRYIYDPEKRDPDSGIEPGTPFEELPEDWVCPECGVGKDEFDKEQIRSRTGSTNRLITTLAESNLYTIPLLILAITDTVLIAIFFVIMLLYKKE